MNLGELVVELSADYGNLEEQLEGAKAIAENVAASIEEKFANAFSPKVLANVDIDNQKLDNLSQSIDRLSKTLDVPVNKIHDFSVQAEKFKNSIQSEALKNPIVVNVDDSSLSKLNEHLSLKEAHLKQVTEFYKNNPIIVFYETDLSNYKHPNLSTSTNDQHREEKASINADSTQPSSNSGEGVVKSYRELQQKLRRIEEQTPGSVKSPLNAKSEVLKQEADRLGVRHDISSRQKSSSINNSTLESININSLITNTILKEINKSTKDLARTLVKDVTKLVSNAEATTAELKKQSFRQIFGGLFSSLLSTVGDVLSKSIQRQVTTVLASKLDGLVRTGLEQAGVFTLINRIESMIRSRISPPGGDPPGGDPPGGDPPGGDPPGGDPPGGDSVDEALNEMIDRLVSSIRSINIEAKAEDIERSLSDIISSFLSEIRSTNITLDRDTTSISLNDFIAAFFRQIRNIDFNLNTDTIQDALNDVINQFVSGLNSFGFTINTESINNAIDQVSQDLVSSVKEIQSELDTESINNAVKDTVKVFAANIRNIQRFINNTLVVDPELNTQVFNDALTNLVDKFITDISNISIDISSDSVNDSFHELLNRFVLDVRNIDFNLNTDIVNEALNQIIEKFVTDLNNIDVQSSNVVGLPLPALASKIDELVVVSISAIDQAVFKISAISSGENNQHRDGSGLNSIRHNNTNAEQQGNIQNSGNSNSNLSELPKTFDEMKAYVDTSASLIKNKIGNKADKNSEGRGFLGYLEKAGSAGLHAGDSSKAFSYINQLPQLIQESISTYRNLDKIVHNAKEAGLPPEQLEQIKSSVAQEKANITKKIQSIASFIEKDKGISGLIGKDAVSVIRNLLKNPSGEKGVHSFREIAKFDEKTMIESGQAAIQALTDAIMSHLSKAYEAGQSMGEGLGKGVDDSSQEVIESTTNMAEDSIQAAKDALDTQSPSKEFEQIGEMVVMGFSKGIKQYLNDGSIISLFTNWTQLVAKSAITLGRTIGKQLVLGVMPFLSSLKKQVTKFANDLQSNVSSATSSFNKKVDANLADSKSSQTPPDTASEPTKRKITLGQVAVAGASIATKFGVPEIVLDIAKQIDPGIEALIGLRNDFASIAERTAGEHIAHVASMAGIIKEEHRGMVADILNNIINTNRKLIDKVASLLLSPLKKIGKSVITGAESAGILPTGTGQAVKNVLNRDLKADARSALSYVKNATPEQAIKDVSKPIVARVKALFKSGQGGIQALTDAIMSHLSKVYDAGQSIGEGLGKGVDDSSQEAVDSTTNMAEDSIQAAKDALDTQSPSKEFEQIGEMVVMGFSKGIKQYLNDGSIISLFTNWTQLVAKSAITLGRTIGKQLVLGVMPFLSSLKKQVTKFANDLQSDISSSTQPSFDETLSIVPTDTESSETPPDTASEPTKRKITLGQIAVAGASIGTKFGLPEIALDIAKQIDPGIEALIGLRNDFVSVAERTAGEHIAHVASMTGIIKEEHRGMVADILNNIINTNRELIDKIASLFLSPLKKMGKSVITGAESAGILPTGTGQAVKNVLSRDLKTDAQSALSYVKDATPEQVMKDVSKPIVARAKALIAMTQKSIAKELAKVGPQRDTKEAEITAAMSEAILKPFEILKNLGLDEVIENKLIALAEEVQSGGMSADEVKEEIESILDNIVADNLGQLSSSVENAGSIGSDVVQALIGGIEGADGSIGSAIAGIADAILSLMHGILTDATQQLNDASTDIGVAVIEGISAGLDADSDSVGDQIIEFCEDLIADAQESLGIQSPSTIFFEIGQQIIQGLSDGLSSFQDVFDNVLNSIRDFISNGLNLVQGAAIGAALLEIQKASLDTAIQYEALTTVITFASGSLAEGKKTIDSIMASAVNNAVPMLSVLEGSANIVSASQFTKLEGDPTREIIDSLVQATAVYNLDSENTKRIMVAVEQMLTKGTVQAEELKSQLGDALPGALNIASRAMGVTTQELMELMQQGRIVAEDFLPRFSQQLKQETASGLALANETYGTAFGTFENALNNLKIKIGNTILPLVKIVIKTVGNMLKFISDNFSVISTLIGINLAQSLLKALSILMNVGRRTFLRPLIVQLRLLKMKFHLFNSQLGSTVGFFGKAKLAGLAMFGGLKAIITGILISFAKVYLIIKGIEFLLRIVQDSSGDFGKQVSESSRQLEQAMKNLSQTPTGIKENTNLFKSFWSAVFGDGKKPTEIGRFFSLFSSGILEQARDAKVRVEELKSGMRDSFNITSTSGNKFNQTIDKIIELDKNLAEVSAKRSALVAEDPTNVKGRQELDSQYRSILNERNKMAQIVAPIQSSIHVQLEATKTAIGQYKEYLESDVFYETAEDDPHGGKSAYGLTKEQIRKEIEILEKEQAKLKEEERKIREKIGEVTSLFGLMERSIRKNIAALDDSSQAIGLRADQQKINAMARVASGELDPSKLSGQISRIETNALTQQVKAEMNTIGLLIRDISSDQISGTFMRSRGLDFNTGMGTLERISSESTITAEQKTVLDTLKKIQELRKSASASLVQVAQAGVDMRESMVSMTKQIADFYKTLERQVKSQTTEINKLTNSIESDRKTNKLRALLTSGSDDIVTQYIESIIQSIETITEMSNAKIDTQEQIRGLQEQTQDQMLQTVELARQIPGGEPIKIPVDINFGELGSEENVKRIAEMLGVSFSSAKDLTGETERTVIEANNVANSVGDVNSGISSAIGLMSQLNNLFGEAAHLSQQITLPTETTLTTSITDEQKKAEAALVEKEIADPGSGVFKYDRKTLRWVYTNVSNKAADAILQGAKQQLDVVNENPQSSADDYDKVLAALEYASNKTKGNPQYQHIAKESYEIQSQIYAMPKYRALREKNTRNYGKYAIQDLAVSAAGSMAIPTPREQRDQIRSDQLVKEADELRKKDDYHGALLKLSQAFNLAEDKSSRDLISLSMQDLFPQAHRRDRSTLEVGRISGEIALYDIPKTGHDPNLAEMYLARAEHNATLGNKRDALSDYTSAYRLHNDAGKRKIDQSMRSRNLSRSTGFLTSFDPNAQRNRAWNAADAVSHIPSVLGDAITRNTTEFDSLVANDMGGTDFSGLPSETRNALDTVYSLLKASDGTHKDVFATIQRLSQSDSLADLELAHAIASAMIANSSTLKGVNFEEVRKVREAAREGLRRKKPNLGERVPVPPVSPQSSTDFGTPVGSMQGEVLMAGIASDMPVLLPPALNLDAANVEGAIADLAKLEWAAGSAAAFVQAFGDKLGINTDVIALSTDSAKDFGELMTDFSNIQPGDIVGWDNQEGKHMGVYLGGDKVAHQSSARRHDVGIYDDLDYFQRQPGAYYFRPHRRVPSNKDELNYFGVGNTSSMGSNLVASTNPMAIARAGKTVTLTFDDGPSEFTPQILDILKQQGIKATFFVTGKNIDPNNPQDVASLRRMVAEGHTIGNHSYNHVTSGRLSPQQAAEEIDKTNKKIAAITGVEPNVVRLPGGAKNTGLHEYLQKHRPDLKIVSWNVDPQDWRSQATASGIRDSVLSQTRNSSANPVVVLLHDGSGDSPEIQRKLGTNRAATVGALPGIITGLRSAGMTIGTPSSWAHERVTGGQSRNQQTSSAATTPLTSSEPLWGHAARFTPSDLSKLTPAGKQALEALKDRRVRAFLDAIADAESGQNFANSESGTYGYGVQHGDTSKPSYSDPNTLTRHPGKAATGRYQFIQSTAEGLRRQLGLNDFKPQSQELMAARLLQTSGALPAILNNDWNTAIAKAGSEWAALEGSPWGQSNAQGRRDVILAKVQKSLNQPIQGPQSISLDIKRPPSTITEDKVHHNRRGGYRKGADGEMYRGDLQVEDYTLSIGGKTDVPVYNAMAGTLKIRDDNPGGYGKYVDILDSTGKVIERIAHLASFNTNLKDGQTVLPGTAVGIQGNTGNSGDIHVHHELPPGVYSELRKAIVSGDFTPLTRLPANQGAIAQQGGRTGTGVIPYTGSPSQTREEREREIEENQKRITRDLDSLIPGNPLKQIVELQRSVFGNLPPELFVVKKHDNFNTVQKAAANNQLLPPQALQMVIGEAVSTAAFTSIKLQQRTLEKGKTDAEKAALNLIRQINTAATTFLRGVQEETKAVIQSTLDISGRINQSLGVLSGQRELESQLAIAGQESATLIMDRMNALARAENMLASGRGLLQLNLSADEAKELQGLFWKEAQEGLTELEQQNLDTLFEKTGIPSKRQYQNMMVALSALENNVKKVQEQIEMAAVSAVLKNIEVEFTLELKDIKGMEQLRNTLTDVSTEGIDLAMQNMEFDANINPDGFSPDEYRKSAAEKLALEREKRRQANEAQIRGMGEEIGLIQGINALRKLNTQIKALPPATQPTSAESTTTNPQVTQTTSVGTSTTNPQVTQPAPTAANQTKPDTQRQSTADKPANVSDAAKMLQDLIKTTPAQFAQILQKEEDLGSLLKYTSGIAIDPKSLDFDYKGAKAVLERILTVINAGQLSFSVEQDQVDVIKGSLAEINLRINELTSSGGKSTKGQNTKTPQPNKLPELKPDTNTSITDKTQEAQSSTVNQNNQRVIEFVAPSAKENQFPDAQGAAIQQEAVTQAIAQVNSLAEQYPALQELLSGNSPDVLAYLESQEDGKEIIATLRQLMSGNIPLTTEARAFLETLDNLAGKEGEIQIAEKIRAKIGETEENKQAREDQQVREQEAKIRSDHLARLFRGTDAKANNYLAQMEEEARGLSILGLESTDLEKQKQMALIRQEQEFINKRIEIERQKATLSPEEIQEQIDALNRLNRTKLNNIQMEFSELALVIKGATASLKENIKGFLTGEKTINDMFQGLVRGALGAYQDRIAGQLAGELGKGLNSLFGINLSGENQEAPDIPDDLFQLTTTPVLDESRIDQVGAFSLSLTNSTGAFSGLNGIIPLTTEGIRALGFAAQSAAGRIGGESNSANLVSWLTGAASLGGLSGMGFSTGFTAPMDATFSTLDFSTATIGQPISGIGTFAKGGLVGKINQSMRYERALTARTPHLIVASEGERILNHRETELWNRLQNSGFQNFAEGGTVGGADSIIKSSSNATTINVPVSVSVDGGGGGDNINPSRLSDAVQRTIQDTIKKEMRPGGSINRGNPYSR